MSKLFVHTVSAAAISLAAFSFSAQAADLTPPPLLDAGPVLAPLYDWSGLYIGGQGGYAWGDVQNSFNVGGGAVTQPDYDVEGAVGGGHLGYNVQFDSLVLGVEGDFEFADLDGNDGGRSGVTDSVDTDYIASVRGRVGWAMDRVLIYATGGIAFVEYDYDLTLGATNLSDSVSAIGPTVGGGLTYAFNDWISAGVEYRYTDFSNETSTFGASAGIAAQSIRHSLEDIHAVRGRVSIKLGPIFGGGGFFQ